MTNEDLNIIALQNNITIEDTKKIYNLYLELIELNPEVILYVITNGGKDLSTLQKLVDKMPE